jgi:acetylornithine deacetylase/succinyl-diaminopimelate desuccinylase-like protein
VAPPKTASTRPGCTPGRWSLFGVKNAQPGKKSVLLYGHQDTVAPLSDWTNPYEPIVDGDKLIGLGGYDMKGGMVAFLDAARETKAYVKVFLAIDEELISKGAWHALAKNKAFFEDVELRGIIETLISRCRR